MKERPTNAYLSIGAYARVYGVSRQTVKKWLAAGLLEVFRLRPHIVRIRNRQPDQHQPGHPSDIPPPTIAVPELGSARAVRRPPVLPTIQMAGQPVPSVPGVYFIRSGIGVKIGCARDLQRRLQALQIGSFQPLCVVGFIETLDKMAATHLEHRLHRQFHDERVRGEWFRLTADIVAVLAAEGQSDPKALLVNVRQSPADNPR